MNLDLPDLRLKPWPAWKEQREAWKKTAEECLYGHAPESAECEGRTVRQESVWNGQGKKETVRIFYGPGLKASFDAVIYSPAAPGKYPAITWNQFSHHDWDECPYEEAVTKRGYIIAGIEREQVVEDKIDGKNPARQAYPAYDWGAIRAWAWAQSRLADYLLTRDSVDGEKLVCTGFSRGGKAALACGIFDERFSVCAPICSGAGGGGCFRYLGDKEGFCQDVKKVESLGRIGSVFPHWWTKNFSRWWPSPDPTQMGLEQEFPLDSHILKALIAPRRLFSIEGIDDAWSNPRGTALTWRAAQPAFDLLGGENTVHYHEGGHAFSLEDWRCLLDYCDHVYRGLEPAAPLENCPF